MKKFVKIWLVTFGIGLLIAIGMLISAFGKQWEGLAIVGLTIYYFSWFAAVMFVILIVRYIFSKVTKESN